MERALPFTMNISSTCLLMNIKFLDLQKINHRFVHHFRRNLTDVLDAGWFLQGGFTQKFEEAFANYCNLKHCVGVANGLDALTLILLAQKNLKQWDDGDEVIVPAHTFVASAQAVVRSGLQPVFVDVDEHDFLLDASRIEEQITSRTRGIMPVHLYGRCCEMKQIHSLARKYDLFIIEDAAQAHGARYAPFDAKAGSLGHAAAFSFYPGKNLGALGDGGAVVSNDERLIEQVRILANYGSKTKYDHAYSGMNSRLDELQAAFLLTKLSALDNDNQRRQAIAQRYIEEIRNPNIELPYSTDTQCIRNSVFHIFPVFSIQRNSLQQHLQRLGISTLIHYPIPLHHQRCFQGKSTSQLHLPNSEKIARRELSIPISPVMEENEVEYVIQTLNSFQT